MDRLDTGRQEQVIGWRKADSAPFDSPHSTPPTSPNAKSTVGTPGAAVATRNKTTGFKRGEQEPRVCFYTSAANNP